MCDLLFHNINDSQNVSNADYLNFMIQSVLSYSWMAAVDIKQSIKSNLLLLVKEMIYNKRKFPRKLHLQSLICNMYLSFQMQ